MKEFKNKVKKYVLVDTGMGMLEGINTYRPISNNSMIGTFCTLGACRNARGRDARHLSTLLCQAFSSPSQSASSPVLLVPVRVTLQEIKYRRRMTLVAYLFYYLSTCKVTFMCLHLSREGHYFFFKVADTMQTHSLWVLVISLFPCPSDSHYLHNFGGTRFLVMGL